MTEAGDLFRAELAVEMAEAERRAALAGAPATVPEGLAPNPTAGPPAPARAPFDLFAPARLQAVPERPPYQFLTTRQIRLRPPLQWLVEGVLPAGGLVFIYGDRGTGKSFIAESIAYSVATGREWMGRAVRPGLALYVAAEGGDGLQQRVEAIEGYYGEEAPRLLYLPEAVTMTNPAEARRLVQAVEAMPEAPSVLILDTLARTSLGADENSSRDMGLLVHALQPIQALGCTVVFIPHCGKATRGPRGSSALEGAADTSISVQASCHLGRTLTIRCEKQKDAAPFGTITAFRQDHLASCVVVEAVPVEPKLAGLAPNAQAVLAVVSAHPEGARRTDIMDETGLRTMEVGRQLDTLIARGLGTVWK